MQKRPGIPDPAALEQQRRRIVAAVASGLAEYGYGRLTVERIIGGTGISRNLFYAHFNDRHEAVLGAYRDIFDRLLVSIEAACGGCPEWPEKVDAGVGAAIDFAIAEPAEARLICIEFSPSDPVLAANGRACQDRLMALLEQGRKHAPAGAVLPPVTERALIGGITFILARHLSRGELEELPALKPQLVQLFLIPYLE